MLRVSFPGPQLDLASHPLGDAAELAVLLELTRAFLEHRSAAHFGGALGDNHDGEAPIHHLAPADLSHTRSMSKVGIHTTSAPPAMPE